MNRQKIFNTVRDHLLKQEDRAMRNKFCCYLTSGGLKCAIGCLIPDGHPGQESGAAVGGLIDKYPDLKLLWGVDSPEDRSFLLSIQIIHDDIDPEEWSEELTSFAKARGLTP